MRHATEADLVRYLDGELGWLARWSVRRHLRTCWQCRTQTDEVRAVVGDYVRYHSAALEHLPEPPRPWRDIRLDMARPPRPLLAMRVLVFAALLALGLGAYVAVTRPVAVVKRSAPEPKPAAPAPASSRPTPPPTRPAAPAAALRIPENELPILAALHRIGADLGEPIEVRKGNDGRWMVHAVGLTGAREAEIRAALPSGTLFTVEQPRLSSQGGERADDGGRTGTALQDMLAPRFGGRVAFEKSANRILSASDAFLARAYALRNLDRRFPAGAALDPESQSLLSQLRGGHREAMRLHAAQLLELTRPLCEALNAAPPEASPLVDAVEAGQRLDEVLNALLAGARTERSSAELAIALTAALGPIAGAAR